MNKAQYVPIDPDAERAVLAAALTSPENYYDIRDVLTAEDFGVEAYRIIFTAMLELEQLGRPIDTITVADELRRKRHLTKAGGVDALNDLGEAASGVENLAAHCDLIAEKGLLRRLVAAGRGISGAALQPDADAEEALQLAEQSVFELGMKRSADSLITMTQAVASTVKEMAKVRNKLLLGHPTGLTDLDRMTGGLQAGQLLIIAARPGVGKSAFALQIARHVAESTGLVVPFLSYEMSHNELTMRMVATTLSYDLHRVRQGELMPGMERDLAVCFERLAALPMMIDDNPPTTISGVRSSMRRLARRGEIGAIFIDYLQLMEGDIRSREPNRVQEIAQISRGLKRLATELQVPVVALSQLNRGLEQRPNKRPVLSDLRESGSLEQDASLVAFLYRDHMYNPAADADMAECIIAKQRNGPVGTIHLSYTPACAKFETTDRVPNAGGFVAGGASRVNLRDPF